MADDEAWGRLVCTTETKSPIRLEKSTIKVGRTSDCDISFVSNKLISAHHCAICRDEDGKTWLTDTSTNGTVLNGRKIKKREKVLINHNDQIHLVHNKNEPDNDIAYIFQDLKYLNDESDLLDNTQEYDVDGTETPGMMEQANRSLEDVPVEAEPESKKSKQDSSQPESQQERDADEKPKPQNYDSMGETLICGICQDIFHDCLSLQPCMHCFCSSCYSQWMDRSNECPTCRDRVEKLSRNHIVNNLVEAYLTENPGKRRSDEELAKMDAINKITPDMIRPKKKKRVCGILATDEVSDSEGSELQTSDDEEETNYSEPGFHPSSFPSLFGFTTIFRPLCRWCPGVARTNANISIATGVTPLSDSSSSVGATPRTDVTSRAPQPVCPDRMVHLMCLCCMKPMPKQEDLPRLQAGLVCAKSQKCGVCSNFYCHLLWKCNKLGCRGCLNEFKDMDFEDRCLDVLILNNRFESQIFKNYLNEKGWSLRELLGKCLEKLDRKEYTTPACVTNPELDSKYILCYLCGLKNFKELAYQFRRDIPKEELPAVVTSRPDCHWGRNCRTQTNPSNPHHASHFNHICEQTRFA